MILPIIVSMTNTMFPTIYDVLFCFCLKDLQAATMKNTKIMKKDRANVMSEAKFYLKYLS